jgi:hypothetical protein
MKKTTRQQTIKLLKARYKEKFIDPLLFKYTRPPIMFDPDQVRLNKQIAKMVECLENAELCKNCNGTGVIVRKIPHLIEEESPWDHPFVGQVVDSRAYSNDICSDCMGNGIVLRDFTEPQFLAKNGLFVKSDDIHDIKCPVCGNPYKSWAIKFDEESGKDCLFSTCHQLTCTIEPSVFKMHVGKSDNRYVEG